MYKCNTYQNYLHDHKLYFSHKLIFIYIIYSNVFLCKQTYLSFFAMKTLKKRLEIFIQNAYCSAAVKPKRVHPVYSSSSTLPSGSMGHKHEDRATVTHRARRFVSIWKAADPRRALYSFPAPARVVSLPGRWVCSNQGLWVTGYTMPSKALIKPVLPHVLTLSPAVAGPSQATSLSLPGRHSHDLLLQVGSGGPHPGPGSYANREGLTRYLARAQLAPKCQRTSVLCPEFAAPMVP